MPKIPNVNDYTKLITKFKFFVDNALQKPHCFEAQQKDFQKLKRTRNAYLSNNKHKIRQTYSRDESFYYKANNNNTKLNHSTQNATKRQDLYFSYFPFFLTYQSCFN